MEIPEGSEVLLYGSFAGTYANMTDTFLKQYVRKRISKKIFVRALLSAEEHTTLHAKEDKKELRETVLLSPKDFPVFQNEIVIYENKIAMISYGDEKIGIIIESAQIADTQRAMFNGFWKLLKASRKK